VVGFGGEVYRAYKMYAHVERRLTCSFEQLLRDFSGGGGGCCRYGAEMYSRH
jgi:hypothetical protein